MSQVTYDELRAEINVPAPLPDKNVALGAEILERPSTGASALAPPDAGRFSYRSNPRHEHKALASLVDHVLDRAPELHLPESFRISLTVDVANHDDATWRIQDASLHAAGEWIERSVPVQQTATVKVVDVIGNGEAMQAGIHTGDRQLEARLYRMDDLRVPSDARQTMRTEARVGRSTTWTVDYVYSGTLDTRGFSNVLWLRETWRQV